MMVRNDVLLFFITYLTFQGMTAGKTFVVQSAEIKATIELGGPTRVYVSGLDFKKQRLRDFL